MRRIVFKAVLVGVRLVLSAGLWVGSHQPRPLALGNFAGWRLTLWHGEVWASQSVRIQTPSGRRVDWQWPGLSIRQTEEEVAEWDASLNGPMFPPPLCRSRFVGVSVWYLVGLLMAGPLMILAQAVLKRKSPPGACGYCGYDLTGNISGTCPECGEPISRQRGGGFSGGTIKHR